MNTEEWLLGHAPGQRWYFDKARDTRSVNFVWRQSLPGAEGEIELAVAEFDFAEGAPSLYFVVLGRETHRELIGDPRFTRWLTASLGGEASLPSGLHWDAIGNGLPPGARDATGRVMGFEQSNTSIRFGEAVVAKVNRRLTIGVSPEAELMPVIARAADTSFAPTSFGVLWLTGISAEPICVALCAEFVPNLGDGWGFLLKQATPGEAGRDVSSEIAEIGRVTALMHNGLVSDPWRSPVAPELIRPEDTAQWQGDALDALVRLADRLAQSGRSLQGEARSLSALLPAALPTLRSQLSGFTALNGTMKIRVHGDYHLGQVLRTPGGPYVIVDFDGEPNRTLAERRAKYSALRDVAGMLRSLAYLRGTLASADDDSASRADWLTWENDHRTTFLNAYLPSVQTGHIRLLPESAEDIRIALTALELEKAIYECAYELDSRPDWLWLPLFRLVRAG